MGIMEMILDLLNLTEMKKHGLHKALQTLLLEWKHFENHLDLTQKCFQRSYSDLQAKENHLLAFKESLTQSSKELDSIRESIEKRFQQVEEKENDFFSFQENFIREMELKEEKLDAIVKDVELREDRMDEQEKLMERLLVQIEMERKGFEVVRKMVDEGVKMLIMKQKRFEDCVKDRSKEVKRVKEVELKEKKLNAMEKELELREKKLDAMKKELDLREKDLSSKSKATPYQMADAKNKNVARVGYAAEIAAGNQHSGSKRLPSEVWKHFTKIVKEDGTSDHCKCNYCNKIFAWSSKGGTTSKLHHISKGKCPVYQKNNTGLQTDRVLGRAGFHQSISVEDEELQRKKGNVGLEANNSVKTERETHLQRTALPNQPRAGSWMSRGTCVAQNATQSGRNTQLLDPKLHQKEQSDPSVHQQLLWASFPYCNTKHCYLENLVSQNLHCERCSKPFTACDMDANFKVNESATCQQIDSSLKGTIEVGTRRESTFRVLTHNSRSQRSGDARIDASNDHKTRSGTQVMHNGKKYDGERIAQGDKAEGFQVSMTEAEKQRYSGDLRCQSGKRGREHVVESSVSSDTSNLSDNEYSLGRFWGNKVPRKGDKEHKVVLYNDDPTWGFITFFLSGTPSSGGTTPPEESLLDPLSGQK